MSGWTSTLLAALAGQLAAAGCGTWSETTTYTSGQTAITIRAIPATPDRCITLSAYPAGGDRPGLADTRVAVQIRCRGTSDPRSADDLADLVYGVMDSRTHWDLDGIAVSQVWRQSYTSLGQDEAGRWERSDNYYLAAMRPGIYRTD